MRVLVVQLARFGDILQTIPVINALKRQNPDIVLDVLVREKYSPAIEGMGVADNVLRFSTKKIMSPIFAEDDFREDSYWDSMSCLEKECESLRSNNYDKIINLSFSPFSSYLTHFLSSGRSDIVRGYSRFDDGFLNITDDTSAYFYAQVGINKFNRFHLIDLFASVADVQLLPEDYHLNISTKNKASRDYMVLHLGASTSNKALPTAKWNQIVKKLIARNEYLVVIGSKEEEFLVEEAFSGISKNHYESKIGKTDFKDLFSIVRDAKCYIGADSGPLHLCNFFNTTCFNISNKEVNYFETGPKSRFSYVWYEDNFCNFDADIFCENLSKAIKGKENDFIRPDKSGLYTGSQHFAWDLIEAIYTGKDFPCVYDRKVLQALIQLNEVNEISLNQLNKFKEGDANQVEILNVADTIMDDLSKECEEVQPLVSWFMTEKTRVGPLPVPSILQKYKELHFKLGRVLNMYLGSQWTKSEESNENDHVQT